MMTKPVADPVSVDLLLTHARWVERFARALVRDDADDVAQDAWMAAIQRPPQDVASPRPWLATVLKNAARMRIRSAERRRARENVVVSREIESTTKLTPEDLAHRMELQRRLASAVLALQEPQRSTIVLVFYEGMSPAQVARQLGVPATTVRSRVRAALEELRAQLDAQDGGERSKWKLALAPLAAGGGMPATAPLWPLAVAAIAIAACAIVLVLMRDASRPTTAVSTTPSTVSASTTAASTSTSPTTTQASGSTTPTPRSAQATSASRGSDPWLDRKRDDDDAASGTPSVTPAFLRAEKTLLEHLDECYELARKQGRNVTGTVVMSVELATRPQVTAEISIDKGTTITDAETLECVRENTAAIESHLDELRRQGENIEGPIRMNVKRTMPPPPPKKEDWPADTDSPPCPAGAHVVGALREKQWCELADGTKHGPEYTWDSKGRLVIIGGYEHGTTNSGLRMRDPDSE